MVGNSPLNVRTEFEYCWMKAIGKVWPLKVQFDRAPVVNCVHVLKAFDSFAPDNADRLPQERRQAAFQRKARLQGVDHLYGAVAGEGEARIDLVVALRDWRFIVPAQSIAEGQLVGDAPVVLHEGTIIVIAIHHQLVLSVNWFPPLRAAPNVV